MPVFLLVFVIGESGSGKSTLTKLLYREEKPNRGSVIVGGINVARLRNGNVYKLRRKIGVVFQDFKLLPKLTVYENVSFALEAIGEKKSEIRPKVLKALELVGLKNKVREYPDMYVVRPAYLMTFLNIITSLSKRYSDLILKKAKEEIDLKDKLDILSDFQSIKNTYLDKQLILLEKDLSDIIKNNQAIKDASERISQACDHIAISYIQKIEEKINTFEIKLNRDIKGKPQKN